jgi:hypothetical protein
VRRVRRAQHDRDLVLRSDEHEHLYRARFTNTVREHRSSFTNTVRETFEKVLDPSEWVRGGQLRQAQISLCGELAATAAGVRLA